MASALHEADPESVFGKNMVPKAMTEVSEQEPGVSLNTVRYGSKKTKSHPNKQMEKDKLYKVE